MKNIILTIAFLLAAAITVSAQTITAPNISLSGPGEFEAVITGSDLSNIAAYQFDIYYDPNVLALEYTDEAHNFGCELVGIDTNMSMLCNGYEAGRLRVVVFGSGSFSGSGDILRTQWVTVEEGSYSDLHFASGLFGVCCPWHSVPIAYEDGSVTVGSGVGVCSTVGC